MRTDTIQREAFKFRGYDENENVIYHGGSHETLQGMLSEAETVALHYPNVKAMIAFHRPAGKSRFIRLNIES